jgi:predicted DNA-binding antitoxin AbrB/MazE fold protein
VTPSILKNGIILGSMAKHFTAVYEEGVLRPEHPLDLPEGEPLHLIVVTQKTAAPNGNVANALAEIAALPLEGDTGAFSGAEHDSVLYPQS